VIAAVNGIAMGGGFEIALACDIIVAAENAIFALPEVRVGLAALAGGVHRLPRTIGTKQALGMILTGRRVSAAEGQQLGFVNEVVPEGQAVEGARRWAAQILEACRSADARHAYRPVSNQPQYSILRRGIERDVVPLCEREGLAQIVFSPLAALIALASAAGLVVSARSLQLGKAVPVIALTSVAANALTIAAGPLVFSEPFPDDPVGVTLRLAAFMLVIVAAALTPAPVHAAETLEGADLERAQAG